MFPRRNGGMFFVSRFFFFFDSYFFFWNMYIYIFEVSTFSYCIYVRMCFYYHPLRYSWPTASFYLFLIFFVAFYLSLPYVRIEVREIGGRKVIVFSQQQDEDTTVATIIIRASTEHVLNDVEVLTCTLHQIFIQDGFDWHSLGVLICVLSRCLWVGQNL